MTNSYEAFVWIPTEHGVSLAEAQNRIQSALKRLPEKAEIDIQKSVVGLTVMLNGFSFSISLASGPHVNLEAKEAFGRCKKDRPDLENLSSYQARFEVVSESPDPEMTHFNDFVLILEALETFVGSKTFDCLSGEFL